MNKELERKLEEAYPFMRKQEDMAAQQAREGGIYQLYWAFGCECSDGWYQLLWDLCKEITEAYETANVPIDLVVEQVKEKFGGLRFYYRIKGQSRRFLAVDIIGQGTLRSMPEGSDIHHQVAAIVQKYEALSSTVCEVCGKPGELRTSLRHIQTLCAPCYAQKKPGTAQRISKEELLEYPLVKGLKED